MILCTSHEVHSVLTDIGLVWVQWLALTTVSSSTVVTTTRVILQPSRPLDDDCTRGLPYERLCGGIWLYFAVPILAKRQSAHDEETDPPERIDMRHYIGGGDQGVHV
ncbi:hypothetical protein EDD17DRAFT_1633181 [Pisolithus thermaeus]|nr:hypothetical protein EDD17DRAFT_1633181 [Pisolithus thermaeus]